MRPWFAAAPPTLTPSPTDVDDLGVLATTAAVVRQSSHVSIDRTRLRQIALELATARFRAPVWDVDLHFGARTPMDIANYVLVLDSLNFCFWAEPRWRVTYEGKQLDGYSALTAVLKRAIADGVPILDARYLAGISGNDLDHVFRGEGRIPLFDARLANLREIGAVLSAKYDCSFALAIQVAGRSAVHLVQTIVTSFPSFDDTAEYRGTQVRFYKRAQICAADVYGAFGGRGLGEFDDLYRLTAFADYKVPQMLRSLGILVYSPELAETIDSQKLIPAGSEEEIEIRAATVWGAEFLRQELESLGKPVRAFELDWYLWDRSQEGSTAPYHRTRTIYY